VVEGVEGVDVGEKMIMLEWREEMTMRADATTQKLCSGWYSQIGRCGIPSETMNK
jgi:hypothetical protein